MLLKVDPVTDDQELKQLYSRDLKEIIFLIIQLVNEHNTFLSFLSTKHWNEKSIIYLGRSIAKYFSVHFSWSRCWICFVNFLQRLNKGML